MNSPKPNGGGLFNLRFNNKRSREGGREGGRGKGFFQLTKVDETTKL